MKRLILLVLLALPALADTITLDHYVDSLEHIQSLLAANQLHRDVSDAVNFVGAMNHGDVGMLQRRGRLCLLQKPAPHIIVVGDFLREDLERDIPVQPRVGRAIDDAHAAAADLFLDAVVPERAASKFHLGGWK